MGNLPQSSNSPSHQKTIFKKTPLVVIIPDAFLDHCHWHDISFAKYLKAAGYGHYAPLSPAHQNFNKVTADKNMRHIRKKVLLHLLKRDDRDIVLVMHGYSSVVASAAAKGLSKAERVKQGKRAGIIGQIFIAGLLMKGGNNVSVKDAFGSSYPPLCPDEKSMKDDERAGLASVYFHDLCPTLRNLWAPQFINPGSTWFTTPVPKPTWGSEEYRGRVAYIRTLDDLVVPLNMQQKMLDESEMESGPGVVNGYPKKVSWVVKDIQSGHSPQLSQSQKLVDIMVELVEGFMA